MALKMFLIGNYGWLVPIRRSSNKFGNYINFFKHSNLFLLNCTIKIFQKLKKLFGRFRLDCLIIHKKKKINTKWLNIKSSHQGGISGWPAG